MQSKADAGVSVTSSSDGFPRGAGGADFPVSVSASPLASDQRVAFAGERARRKAAASAVGMAGRRRCALPAAGGSPNAPGAPRRAGRGESGGRQGSVGAGSGHGVVLAALASLGGHRARISPAPPAGRRVPARENPRRGRAPSQTRDLRLGRASPPRGGALRPGASPALVGRQRRWGGRMHDGAAALPLRARRDFEGGGGGRRCGGAHGRAPLPRPVREASPRAAPRGVEPGRGPGSALGAGT